MAMLIYALPIWVLASLMLALGVAFAVLSIALVRRSPVGAVARRHGELVAVVVTTAALFYSILLAFMTVTVWEAQAEARESSYREAGLVRALDGMAGALPQPVAVRLHDNLVAYLDHVVAVEWPRQTTGAPIDDVAPPLAALRHDLAAWASNDGGAIAVSAELLHLLDRLTAARTTRLGVQDGHVPPLIWTLIVLIGLLTVGLGAFLPAESGTMHAAMLGAMVATIILVLVMIIELDYPYRGNVKISPAPFAIARAAIY